jgi:glycosyltransferase involved in cell wall biosynthesis
VLLSICIPSYNRPELLKVLLESIDCDPARVEVVVSEDHAPRREEVRAVVQAFAAASRFRVSYEENQTNMGYDGNLRRLIEAAKGDFALFMGDDDWFHPGQLAKYLDFLGENQDVGYVLRSYYSAHPDGTLETFKYLPRTARFEPGIRTCAFLFKRSVCISGVTFRRSSILPLATSAFDGTLLYQVYLVAEVGYAEPSVYCDIPVAVARQSFRDDLPNFGVAEAEKGRFQPGTVTEQNSINFTKSYFEVSQAFDQKHGTDLTERIRLDLSRYSYPFLSIQRKRGWGAFWKYSRRLAAETHLNATWHYTFYVVALLLLGERVCDKGIVWIKRLLGHTPSL